MKHKRSGYTLVEIALFVALSGLLFMGIVIGTGNSIASQRFFDSTQNFAEFLRSIYSQVSNPQSVGSGNSNYLIYGKLISFGQNTIDLDYEPIPSDEQRVFVYDIIGSADIEGSGSVLELMRQANASVVIPTYDPYSSRIASVAPAGLVESYQPKWSASIEKTTKNTTDNRQNLYTGTIMIVRHPRSGTINTFVSSEVIQVNELVSKANQSRNQTDFRRAIESLMTILNYSTSTNASLRAKAFVSAEVNFCVNPEGVETPSTIRHEVRLVAGAHNASSVEIIDLDDRNSSDDGTVNKCL